MTPPLKWFGGKHYLAPKLARLVPPHLHYVEPYAGGLALLLHLDPEGRSEVVNDLDGALANFWMVLRHEALFPQFMRACQATEFGQDNWEAARDYCTGGWVHTGKGDVVLTTWAYYFFVFCRQSRGGQMQSFATLSRTRTRGGMNEQASAWLSCVDGLPEVHARLRRVVVLNDHAPKVIATQGGRDTFFYCDPPYLHSERVAGGYAYEMLEADHEEMLDALMRSNSKVMLSGYPSALYDRRLAKWRRVVFETPNHASSAAVKEIKPETVWMNY